MCECMQNNGAVLDSDPKLGMYDMGPLAVGYAALVTPNVDTKAMSASVVISTSAVDRQRERIIASGLQIENYNRNPVVLWEHGLDPAVPFPVGKAKSPTGEIMLKSIGDTWESTCFFSQTNPLAYQVFGLVAEDIIRAASVQALPHPGYVTREYDEDGQPVVVVNRAELVEWSWGRLGVNPEAVRKTLSFGRIGDQRIIPALVKSLSACLPPKKIVVPGADLTARLKAAWVARRKSFDESKVVRESGRFAPKGGGASGGKMPSPPSTKVAGPKPPSPHAHVEKAMLEYKLPDEVVRRVMGSKDPELALNDLAYGVESGGEHAESAARAYESARKIKRKSGVETPIEKPSCGCGKKSLGLDRYAVRPAINGQVGSNLAAQAKSQVMPIAKKKTLDARARYGLASRLRG